MAQREQREFQEGLEAALSWMRAAQERLHDNDNTQGPRDALEARLRETEKIHGCEHEGRMLVDKVLVAAESILQTGDEKLRADTNAKVKDLKAQWEETSTYIIHCHSRIEWVWLHWSEYLKAHEEFEVWLARLGARLAADVELQLGAREKLWQADHQQVLLSDVCGQAPLLERLLDEGAALYGRTQDPSVEPSAQEALQQAYNDVRDRAEERLAVLQKMAEEHQMYLGCVHKFQTWLLGKTKELTELLEREDSDENRFQALQALDGSVAREEMSLQHLEGVAEAVQSHTSPAGAQQVARETLELRQGWLRLRQDLREASEVLRSGLDAHGQYLERQRRLSRDIVRLQQLLKELDRELEEGRGGPGTGVDGADRSEEQLVGRWKKYTGIRNTLMSEEPQMEHLKAQLKDLFRFSEDSSHLSDDVLAVVKEHQSVKCRATRLCSESESSLRQVLQDPLHFFAQWSEGVSQVLDASAEVTDSSHIAMLVQNIERLLKHSVQLQERLNLLQARADLLAPVFGSQHAEGLGTELSTAAHSRDLLHVQLQQRKSQLQGVLSRTKQFGDAHEVMRCTLSKLQDRLAAADVLQPDILAKKSKADQLGAILKDLEACEPQMMELETLVSSSGINRTQFDKLYAEWKSLCKAVRVRVGQSEDSIVEHEGFHESLLGVEKWLMIMRQKLESFRGPMGVWSVDQRQHEAERALGEFPEKELQLHKTEARGLRVLERTSEEGRVHIRRDMKRLRESWMSLHDLSLNLYRLLNSSTEEPNSDLWSVAPSAASLPAGGDLSLAGSGASWMEGLDQDAVGQSRSPRAPHSQSSADEKNLKVGLEEGAEGLRASYVDVGSGAQMVDGEVVLLCAQPVTHGGSQRPRMPVFGTEDDVQDGATTVGNRPYRGWADERTEGGSGDSLDSGRSHKGLVPVEGGAVGPAPGIAGEWALSGRSMDATTVHGRGQGGGTNSRQEVVSDGTPKGRRSGRPAAAEGLGQGGGAFTRIRKTPLQSSSSSSSSPQGSATTVGVSHLWQSNQSLTGSGGDDQSPAEYESRRIAFEAWLLEQNELLFGLLSTKRTTLGPKQLKIRREKLQGLRANVGSGQELFQLLIQDSQIAGYRETSQAGAGGLDEPEPFEDAGLEDLRYRWMLYKSKLKEVEDLPPWLTVKDVGATEDVPVKAKRIVKKSPGLLQRVCRVALPLWLLFLALLLLAFLLPFMEGASSCSLTNNFARSFNVMLRYDGPPPT